MAQPPAQPEDLYRDYVVSGNPLSGAYKPEKALLRAYERWILDAVQTLLSSAGLDPTALANLQQVIANEAQARIDADTALGGRIDAEGAARMLVEALASIEPVSRIDEMNVLAGPQAGTAPIYGYNGTLGLSVWAERDVLNAIRKWGQSNSLASNGPTAVPGAAIATTPYYRGRALMPDIGAIQGPRVGNGIRIADLIDAYEMQFTTSYGSENETSITSLLTHLVRACDAVTSSEPVFAGMVSGAGGTFYRQIKEGSEVAYRLDTALADIVEVARREGKRVVVRGTFMSHGENHTDGNYTEEQIYQNIQQHAFAEAMSVMRITGQKEWPILYIAQTSAVQAGGRLDQPVQLAQRRAGRQWWCRVVGPTYQLPRATTNSGAGVESIHYNAIGQNRLGQIEARAMFNHQCGLGWMPLDAKRVRQISATQFLVDCDVPVAPLVIDTSGADITLTGLQGLYGFDVQRPDGTYAPIASVAVQNGTQLLITLTASADMPGTWTVAYGMRRNADTDSNDGPVLGARGCVRDSAADTNIWTSYVQRNWMISWAETVYVAGGLGATIPWSAALAWTGGTPTNAAVNLATYKKVTDKLVFVKLAVYSGTPLNGATVLNVTGFPFTAAAGSNQHLVGTDAGTEGDVKFKIAGGGTSFKLLAGGLNADRYYQCSGFIEIQ